MAIALFGILFALIGIGVPIAIALGAASMLVLIFYTHTPVMVLVQKSFSSADTFALMAIPFFILAGNIMSQGGVSQRLVELANCGFGRYRGGLAHVATAACTFFGAICGSAPATTAAIGAVMVQPMMKKGYDRDFTAAVVATSGTIGLIIPPSNNMVLFGVITGASVGQMFIGGILPGLIMSAGIMAVNYWVATKKNYPREAPPAPGDTMKAFKNASLALLMPIIILGGIYSGAFTPTEAAVVAAAYGIVVGMFIYKNINFAQLRAILLQTAVGTAIIMFLVVTASCFSYIMASEQIPQAITSFMLSLSQDPLTVLLLICVALLIVGTFLDNAVALILCTPIFFPVVASLGIDPVFFGVITVFALAIGQVTPPVGLCLFVASNMADVSIERISVQCVPYLIMLVLILLLLVLCPQIITILPSFML